MPKGVIEKDARSILSADSLSAFPVNGVPSMVHFTDYFRFIMFSKTDEIWADTDIFLARRFDLNNAGDWIGREKRGAGCPANLTTRRSHTGLNRYLLAYSSNHGKTVFTKKVSYLIYVPDPLPKWWNAPIPHQFVPVPIIMMQ
ncbi:hypothetical protein [Paraburkholderia sp. RAU2J]|uniref:hypothetical protein n=1 Tax=Paraburkholderia sp. RAU2J TaxID=1938810 RepID=UPI001F541FEA|nr:hypothetical protein [Paraburkholderia sp. RAU2J]